MKWWQRFWNSGISAQKTGVIMEKQPAPAGQPMQIQIDATNAEGIYSNLVLLAHSPSEFILDFARLLPGIPQAKVYARIIMTPQAVRSLHRALESRIDSYEAQFGKIRLEGDPATKTDIGFKTG